MVFAVVLGAALGLVGIAPLLLSRNLALRGKPNLRENSIAIGLLSVMISAMILAGSLILVSQLFAEAFVPFAVSVVATFFAGTIVLAIIGFKQ